MPAERYFSESLFSSGDKVLLQDQELHHLVHVMRGAIGEHVELVNGKGQLAMAKVASISRKAAELVVEAVEEEEPSSFEVIIAQATPRLQRLDFILEKGTELGMTQIWLFPGDRSEIRELSASKTERLRTLTVAAMKQCGRLFLPSISLLPPLKKWSPLHYPAYFGDTHPEAPSFLSVLEKGKASGVIFFVGPESGFSDDELKEFQRLNARGVKLHKNILRTDTASLAALSLLGGI